MPTEPSAAPVRAIRGAGTQVGRGGRGYAKWPSGLGHYMLEGLRRQGKTSAGALGAIGTFVQLRGDLVWSDGRPRAGFRDELLCSLDTWKRAHQPALSRLALWAVEQGGIRSAVIKRFDAAEGNATPYIALDRVGVHELVGRLRGVSRASSLLGLLIVLVELADWHGRVAGPHCHVADRLGLSPNTLRGMLHDLAEQGIIDQPLPTKRGSKTGLLADLSEVLWLLEGRVAPPQSASDDAGQDLPPTTSEAGQLLHPSKARRERPCLTKPDPSEHGCPPAAGQRVFSQPRPWRCGPSTRSPTYTAGRVAAFMHTARAARELLDFYRHRSDYPGIALLRDCLTQTEAALARWRDGTDLVELTRDRVDATARLVGRIDQLVRIHGVELIGRHLADPLESPTDGIDRVVGQLAQLHRRLDPLWETAQHDPRVFQPGSSQLRPRPTSGHRATAQHDVGEQVAQLAAVHSAGRTTP